MNETYNNLTIIIPDYNITKRVTKDFSKDVIFLVSFNIAYLLTALILIHTTKSFLKSIPSGRKLVRIL